MIENLVRQDASDQINDKKTKINFHQNLLRVATLKPQSPQATVCCKVGAAALVHLRPGGPGLPNRGFK